MKSWKHALLFALVMITILSLLLSACGPLDNSKGNPDRGKDRDTEQKKEKGNDDQNDSDEDAGVVKVTICHRTGSAKNPYVEISISNKGAEKGHAKHEGDLIPAPAGGCPDTAATDVPVK